MDHTQAPSESASSRPTPGQMLRAAREAKGMHLAVLSVTLKVPTSLLEALENDQHEAFKGKGAAFVRALAQSVSRHLGIDPAPVLAGLPKTAASSTIEPVAIQTTASHAGRGPSGLRKRQGRGPSRTVWLLAALMLVVSAFLLWWPNRQDDAADTQDASLAAVPMGQANDPVETPVEPASADQPVAPATAQASVPEMPAAKPLPVLPVVPASAPVVAPVSPAVPAASQAADTTAQSPLVIHPTVTAWIEVRDSKGQMAVKRLVKAGEVLQLDVSAPLFVYVGHADTTELRWRGQVVDLKPHTQNNEARLQIKP